MEYNLCANLSYYEMCSSHNYPGYLWYCTTFILLTNALNIHFPLFWNSNIKT